MEAVRTIRNIRAEMEVAPSRKAKVIIVASETGTRSIFDVNRVYLQKLASASEVIIQEDKANIPADAVTGVVEGAEIFIPLEELVDIEKEIERLEKERVKLEKELERVSNKLSNKGFLEKAPEDVVEAERNKKEKYQDMMDKVLERLAHLKK
jgi:valyl-tRNA synthetase